RATRYCRRRVRRLAAGDAQLLTRKVGSRRAADRLCSRARTRPRMLAAEWRNTPMPERRRLALVLLSGTALAAGTALPAAAGQCSGTLAVSVDVVAACSASTGGGAASTGCTGAAPVAVMREASSAPASNAGAPGTGAPVARTVEDVDVVTVI